MFRYLLFVFFMLISVNLFAFDINKPKIRLELAQGESHDDTIVVSNNSPNSLAVRVYYQDFIYVAPFDGSKEFFPPSSTDHSVENWLSFSPSSFELGSGQSREVHLNISPDKDFDTVHNGVLFFETSLGVTVNEQGQMTKALGRIGSIVFVDPEGANREVNLDIKSERPYSFVLGYENTGNSLLNVTPSYYIINDAGEFFDRGTAEMVYFMPGDKDTNTMLISKKLSAGSYIMVLTVDLEDGAVAVYEVEFDINSAGNISINNIIK